MKGIRTAITLGLCFSAVGCGDAANSVIDAVGDALSGIGQQSAIADTLGFDVSQPFPSRDTSYDGWLKGSQGLSQAQLSKLVNHVAMPQSHDAMVSLLGWPDYEHDNYLYWAIEGGSSELAVEYSGNIAMRYTVGY